MGRGRYQATRLKERAHPASRDTRRAAVSPGQVIGSPRLSETKNLPEIGLASLGARELLGDLSGLAELLN
jgi:hypothetical protein